MTTKQNKWDEIRMRSKVWMAEFAQRVDNALGGHVEQSCNKVLEDRTDSVTIRIAPPKKTSSEVKVILSTENNTGVTRAILESVIPGNPLREVKPESGTDVNRLARSQVLLTNKEGTVCGMGTYVKTQNGFRLITLRHVLWSCTRESNVVMAVSPLTGRGMALTPLDITRQTSFRVGTHVDVRAVLRTPADFGSRLALTAASAKETFKEGHGIVFSPPEGSGGALRYCSGRVGKLGKTGLLTFSGSTLEGTSGSGVFVGNHMVSTHVGALVGMGENVSFYNIPPSGAPANEQVRHDWLAKQHVSFESAFPETRPWLLVNQLREHDDDEAYGFTDVDAEGDSIRITKYEALADEYTAQRVKEIAKAGHSTQLLAQAMFSNDYDKWDDSDDDDQDLLHDMHEEPVKEKAARMGKRGLLKQASMIPKVRLESSDEAGDSAAGDALDQQIAETRALLAVKEASDKRDKALAHKVRELAQLRSKLLGKDVDLESHTPKPQDFGKGEQSPLETTASKPTPLLKDSEKSGSTSKEITASCKDGSTSDSRLSSKAKKKKRKKQILPSESGGDVSKSEAAMPPNVLSPTSTLASLTQKLEAMALRIEELKPAVNP